MTGPESGFRSSSASRSSSVLVGAGLVGGFAYMVAQQVKVQEMPAAAGQEEFDRVVARFAGQQAFIEMPGDSGGEDEGPHHELEQHGTRVDLPLSASAPGRRVTESWSMSICPSG